MNTISLWLACVVFAITIQVMLPVSEATLQVGYYKHSNTCVTAESIVKGVVHKYIVTNKNRGFGAGLIRMFFHDCFVRGCDASVLLNATKNNPNPERLAIPNNPSLRGFEVIDEAKSELEKVCPGVVSCADIIAFAARDAAFLLGNISYKIPSGRYDGNVSIGAEALQLLPAPFFNLAQLNASFSAVGLSIPDMVALSGAHSIGRSHCSSFQNRLYPIDNTTMNQTFGVELQKKCPKNATTDGVVPLDFTPGPDNLDKQYYDNVKALKGLFFSDFSLLNSTETKNLVEGFRTTPGLFEQKFAESMIKMGYIGVLNKNQGEIRTICSVVNPKKT